MLLHKATFLTSLSLRMLHSYSLNGKNIKKISSSYNLKLFLLEFFSMTFLHFAMLSKWLNIIQQTRIDHSIVPHQSARKTIHSTIAVSISSPIKASSMWGFKRSKHPTCSTPFFSLVLTQTSTPHPKVAPVSFTKVTIVLAIKPHILPPAVKELVNSSQRYKFNSIVRQVFLSFIHARKIYRQKRIFLPFIKFQSQFLLFI